VDEREGYGLLCYLDFIFVALPVANAYLNTVIGIIKRKALIKELAAVYHGECLAYCQELLELQKKWNEVFHLCISIE
ncbi:hypothetical protein Godav_022695, partial [Gossypium davidsonii]|nr:hypothetical protein [Gossypium davidsonii]